MKRPCFLLSLGLACLWLAGCVEIDQTIRFNEDGSGRFIEVVRLSDALLEASKSSPDFAALTDCLSEARAKERVKDLGEVRFVSHQVKDLGSKGLEVTTVYAFDDINRFTLPATPHRGANWPDQKLTFKLGRPVVVHEAWRNAYYRRRPLSIAFTSPLVPKVLRGPEGKTEQVREVERSPSPAEREGTKALLPVVRTMIGGFRMTLTLEAFGPVEGKSKTYTVFSLSADDLKSDETLMQVIDWNRYPDRWLGARGRIGGAGRILNEPITIGIALPFEKTDGTGEAQKP